MIIRSISVVAWNWNTILLLLYFIVMFPYLPMEELWSFSLLFHHTYVISWVYRVFCYSIIMTCHVMATTSSQNRYNVLQEENTLAISEICTYCIQLLSQLRTDYLLSNLCQWYGKKVAWLIYSLSISFVRINVFCLKHFDIKCQF